MHNLLFLQIFICNSMESTCLLADKIIFKIINVIRDKETGSLSTTTPERAGARGGGARARIRFGPTQRCWLRCAVSRGSRNSEEDRDGDSQWALGPPQADGGGGDEGGERGGGTRARRLRRRGGAVQITGRGPGCGSRRRSLRTMNPRATFSEPPSSICEMGTGRAPTPLLSFL